MSKYTNGPWEVGYFDDEDDNINSIGVFAGPEALHIIDPQPYAAKKRLTDSQIRANAHLIAAAPDLLDACRAALADMPSPSSTDYQTLCDFGALGRKLEAAIAKAEPE